MQRLFYSGSGSGGVRNLAAHLFHFMPDLVATGLLCAPQGHPAPPSAGQGRLGARRRLSLPVGRLQAMLCFPHFKAEKQTRSKRRCWFKFRHKVSENNVECAGWLQCMWDLSSAQPSGMAVPWVRASSIFPGLYLTCKYTGKLTWK